MRAWLYDLLNTDEELQQLLRPDEGDSPNDLRVMPRRSESNIPEPNAFLIYGMGNSTNESLGDSTAQDHEAHRQFFQVWVHHRSGTYTQIDLIGARVKTLVTGSSSIPDRILTVRWLEDSQEFSNETYNTLFRYIRFQAIIATTEGYIS